MMEKNLRKLEFDKILDILSHFARTFIGKHHCLSLLPFSNIDDIKKELAETREATIMLQRKGEIPLSEISDITVSLKFLKAAYSISSKQLLDLASLLKLSRNLKEYFSLDIGILDTFPNLDTYFSSLYSNKSIEDNIFSCIIDENTIDDKASSELYKIRKQQIKISR